ncbi:MAG: hypothetical protein EXR98_05665 [Gemmataceae bacterium]|nr:hypothetical protein [Gemmataceae bacterium]
MSDPAPNHEDIGIKAGLPPEPPPPLRDALAYQPISGWAIAGLTAGGLFALLVIVSTAVGLFQGAPVFFPIWIVGVPIVGMILSWTGQRHVQNSEGTRAGAPLARWGFGISLVSGLTYFAYYFVTGLAVQNQANAFMMEKGDEAGFFQMLREGGDNRTQLNAAFLLTLPATGRSGRPDNEITMRANFDRGKDGQPGQLTSFREGIFGRVLYKQLAKDAEITALGVRDWHYEKRGYKVHREYRIKTKEVALHLYMSAGSTEGEAEGQGRKWFVNLNDPQIGEGVISKTLTPLGEGVGRLRAKALGWLEKRLRTLGEGNPFPDVAQADQTEWPLMLTEDGKWADRKVLIHHAFAAGEKKFIGESVIITKPDDIGKWEDVAGKIRLHLTFRMVVIKNPGAFQPIAYNIDASAGVETSRPINPERYGRGEPEPEWNLVNLHFLNVSELRGKQKGPGPQ